MLPNTDNLKEVEVISIPSVDYRLEIDGEHVTGSCNDLESMKQVIFCILNTERYRFPIYSWNYGVELQDLYGKPRDYVMSVLQQRITEALMQDERIESVDNFEFEIKGSVICIEFTAHTIFGDVTSEKRWG